MCESGRLGCVCGCACGRWGFPLVTSLAPQRASKDQIRPDQTRCPAQAEAAPGHYRMADPCQHDVNCSSSAVWYDTCAACLSASACKCQAHPLAPRLSLTKNLQVNRLNPQTITISHQRSKLAPPMLDSRNRKIAMPQSLHCTSEQFRARARPLVAKEPRPHLYIVLQSLIKHLSPRFSWNT